MFMNFSESGKGNVYGHINQFRTGAMVAAQVGTEQAAKNIVSKAKKNLDSMKDPARDATSTGTPLKDGIGYSKSGGKWKVYSMPVRAGDGSWKMPAAVEFGRGPLPSRPNQPYKFRQKGKVRPSASGVEPKPYFREAIRDVKGKSMDEVMNGMRGVI